jgi:hypothetical protein
MAFFSNLIVGEHIGWKVLRHQTLLLPFRLQPILYFTGSGEE